MFHLSPRLPRSARAGLLALPLLLLTGCVKERTTGNETMFSYELWVPAAMLLGGAAAAPLGWALREKSGRLGWGLMIGGVVAAIGFGPTYFLDRIEVSPDHFLVRDGMVGMATTYDVKFADVKAAHMTTETTRGRRGRKSTKAYLVCDRKDGSSTKVPLNGRLAEAAVIPIMAQLVDHKIPISDETGGEE